MNVYLVEIPTDGKVKLEMCGPFHSSSGKDIIVWSCSDLNGLCWTRYESTGEFPSYGRFHDNLAVRLLTSNISRFDGASGLSKDVYMRMIGRFRKKIEKIEKKPYQSFGSIV